MFKRFTILCVALTFLSLPLHLGCAGRPPKPEISEEAADFGMGGDEGETTTEMSDFGTERPVNDGVKGIDQSLLTTIEKSGQGSGDAALVFFLLEGSMKLALAKYMV